MKDCGHHVIRFGFLLWAVGCWTREGESSDHWSTVEAVVINRPGWNCRSPEPNNMRLCNAFSTSRNK